MDYRALLDQDNIPQHIAIIMDGNGRWAKQKFSRNRIFGHHNGVKAVRKTTEAGRQIGVKYLTLYAFSTENWNRPATEVNALMSLLVQAMDKEIGDLVKNGVQLRAIGNLDDLPQKTRDKLNEGIERTKHNTELILTLALSYSSRWELTEAVKNIAADSKNGLLDPSKITGELISSYLETKDLPDPELLIRTSGEQRISNYLLWQIAYSELYFTQTLWPDFDEDELYKAVWNYQQRERRFGKISQQITAK